MAHPGDVVPGYVIDGLAGRGGTAQVFFAHKDTGHDDTGHDGTGHETRPVAVKVLDPVQRNPENIDRLHREFEIPHRFSHPRIITMYDDGDYWLTMQAVDGGSAKDLVGTDQTWLIEVKLTVLQQIAGALDYIHEHDVVHCDVKPSNILRKRSGDAVLTDFGIAQVIGGTPAPRRPVVHASLPYAAPELLLGGPVTGATDEYALACTAVELFDGKPPFTARTPMKLMDLQLRGTAWPISYRHKNIPRAFDSIVLKALSKDPLDRYPSCTEFVTLLTHALT